MRQEDKVVLTSSNTSTPSSKYEGAQVRIVDPEADVVHGQMISFAAPAWANLMHVYRSYYNSQSSSAASRGSEDTKMFTLPQTY